MLEKVGKNSENSKENVNNKKNTKELKLKIWKKELLLMNKNLKVSLIIPTLNTKTIPASNLFEIF